MYDNEILGDILSQSDCRVIDDTGHPHPPKHAVYELISKRMLDRGTKCKPTHVYNIINNDRNGLRTLVHEKYKIPFKPKRINNTTVSMNRSTQSSVNVAGQPYTKKLRVVLSAEIYQTMKPTLKIYSDRAYWKFSAGWTDIMATRIYEQHEQYCVIAFKNNIVHPTPNAEFYAQIDGKCSECKATITGTLLKEPAPNTDVVFTVEMKDIIEQLHTGTKKRQLRGPRLVHTATCMVKERKAAATFRIKEAKRLKKFGRKDPPILPSAEVLRKAKEQHLLKTLGLTFGNPALNLYHHSKNGKHAGTVRKIGLDKFYCIYWTPEQQQIYTQRCKNNPTAVFTIDATGGVVSRDKEEDPAVLLYQCMIIDDQGSAPAFQMVSADQTALMIAYFLWFILTPGVPVPKNVVTDFGWAILIAIARVFGLCNDLKDYLQKCYDVAVLRQKTLPNTYIRLDVSHLIRMVTRWKSLRGKDLAVRNFHKRCVAQAYQMFKLETLKSFMENILLVSLSQYIGYTKTNVPLPSEKSIQSINKLIQGTSISEEEEPTNGEDENMDTISKNDDSADTGWKTWADKIYARANRVADKSSKGSIINGCYNPSFAKQFKTQLMPYVALWTGIMRPHFRRGTLIATSSAVESEFADLKKRSLNGILPTRADKFVLQHIEDHLDGKVKLASNEGDLTSISQQKFDGPKSTSKHNLSDLSKIVDGPECEASASSQVKKANSSLSLETHSKQHCTNEIPTNGSELESVVALVSTQGDHLTLSSHQKSDGLNSPFKYDLRDLSDVVGRPDSKASSQVKKKNSILSLETTPVRHPTEEMSTLKTGLKLDIGLTSNEGNEALFSQQYSDGAKGRSVHGISDLSEIIGRPDCEALAFSQTEEANSILSWENVSKHHCTKEMPTDESGLESGVVENSPIIIGGRRQTSTPIDFMQWNTCEPWGGLAKTSIIEAMPKKKPPPPPSPEQRRKKYLDKFKNSPLEKKPLLPKMRRQISLDRCETATLKKKPLLPKKRRKMTSLDKCKEWHYVKDVKNTHFPMLRNGLVSGVVDINDVTYNIIRTCAFDSTYQVILNGIACSKTYAEQIAESSSKFIMFAFSVLEGKKITKEHYEDRGEILLGLNMFKDKITSYARVNEKGIMRLDADSNVGDLVSSIFVLHPSCTKNVACTCGFETIHPCISLPVDVDILLKKGFHMMQEAIDNAQLSKRTCRKCKNAREDEIVWGPHIMIELDVITDKNYTIDASQPPRHGIDSISSTISMGGKTYILAGLVHYDSRHHIAYTKTGLYWHKYNDMFKERQCTKENEKVKPHLFIYVISDVQAEGRTLRNRRK